jgi:hypothetical protein
MPHQVERATLVYLMTNLPHINSQLRNKTVKIKVMVVKCSTNNNSNNKIKDLGAITKTNLAKDMVAEKVVASITNK